MRRESHCEEVTVRNLIIASAWKVFTVLGERWSQVEGGDLLKEVLLDQPI